MTVIKTLRQLSKRFKEINKGSDDVVRINKTLNELGWKEKERFYCQGTEIIIYCKKNRVLRLEFEY